MATPTTSTDTTQDPQPGGGSHIAPGAGSPIAPGAGTVAADPIAEKLVTPGERWSNVLKLVGENRKASVGVALVGFFLLVAIVGPFFAPYNPTQMGVGNPMSPPGAAHWFGTTQTGQDLFSQFLVGTRSSVLVGFGVGVFGTLIALIVGMSAGYLGGWLDEILMLITNVFLTLPALPLMIVVGTYAHAFNLKGLWVIIGVLSLTGWPWGARVKRSQILSLRSKDFVMAARVSGEGFGRIVFVEIMPNMLSLIASQFIFTAVFAVLAEAGLEYIGLGDLNSVTWGTTLYWAGSSSALLQGLWWWFIPPGLAIGLYSLGLTLTNYALDEMTNPRLRAQRARAGGGAIRQSTTTAPHETKQTETRPDATVA